MTTEEKENYTKKYLLLKKYSVTKNDMLILLNISNKDFKNIELVLKTDKINKIEEQINLFNKIAEDNYIEKLESFIMPFGKYEGLSIYKVYTYYYNYIIWLKENYKLNSLNFNLEKIFLECLDICINKLGDKQQNDLIYNND
jgi:uncharacterized protein (DUF3820 family)